jgi:hypothetical protein
MNRGANTQATLFLPTIQMSKLAILLGQQMSGLYERSSRQAGVARNPGSGKSSRVAGDSIKHQPKQEAEYGQLWTQAGLT